MKIYKIVSVKEKACDDKLNEMAQKYGKEINDLRNKLNDANLLIDNDTYRGKRTHHRIHVIVDDA